jgi:hypothetical protein
MSTDSEMPREVGEPASAIPPMPTPKTHELWTGTPFPLGNDRYSIGWQGWPETKGGPGFCIIRRGAMTDKVVNRYPLTQEGWAEAWRELTALDQAAADQVRATLARRAEADAAAAAKPTATGRVIPPRSSPEVRARLLQLIKQANPKYAKPFEKDRMAAFSLVGTESWAEYGQVVLQMAILDTLLSIEELLTKANDADGSAGPNEVEEP